MRPAFPLQVPILAYHDIAPRSETSSRLAVPPTAFSAQLAYLHDAGFKTITAGAFSAVLAGDEIELPERTVVLTFDDGYESFYSRVIPLLSHYRFTATVFVTTGWVQDAGTHTAGETPGRMLSWSQITEATRTGIEVGAHGCRHLQLDQLPEWLLREELYTGKELLEQKLGLPVDGLAYPFGYSNGTVRQAAREADYSYGYAVRNMMANPTSDLFALPRLTVRRATTLPAFQQIAHGRAPITLLQDRALTKGWAAVRRARGALKKASLGM